MNSVVVCFRPDRTAISPRWCRADQVADRRLLLDGTRIHDRRPREPRLQQFLQKRFQVTDHGGQRALPAAGSDMARRQRGIKALVTRWLFAGSAHFGHLSTARSTFCAATSVSLKLSINSCCSSASLAAR